MLTGVAAAPLAPSAGLSNETCLACHGDPQLEAAAAGRTVSLYVDAEAIHASAHGALECVACHRDVAALPHRGAIARVECTRCHYVESLPAPPGRERVPAGLHQRVREQGRKGAPTCRDCHGAHDIKPPGAVSSSLGRQGAPATCGACHPRIARDYRESIHGTEALAGNADVPGCADCHPEHPGNGRHGVPAIARGSVVATCVACHDDPGLQRRYALPAGRLVSYLGSYHGAATELGSSRTANCASCHGAHFILPSHDPRSTVNSANLPRTCGACHPGAGVNFAVGAIHLQPSPTQDRAVFWVRVAYQLFVAGLILAFLAYIGLDLLARVRRRFGPAHRLAPGEQEPQFERLTLNQRLQHWTLIASFAALIITGFPLLLPRAEISRGVVTALGGAGARAVIHRGAALLLIALVIYHLAYVLFSRRGHWEFRQLLPGLRDAVNVVHMLGFYFGLTPTRPAFDRYNYIEKFEYLAVAWGSVIMITTGALLWSPLASLAVLPKWLMDVALIVHGWEAILAFLAIIIWHMYNVHWNPSVFPMSRIWLIGKVGLHELRENHPLEWERIAARRGNDGLAAPPEGRHDGGGAE